jgi:hypothetical protein
MGGAGGLAVHPFERAGCAGRRVTNPHAGCTSKLWYLFVNEDRPGSRAWGDGSICRCVETRRAALAITNSTEHFLQITVEGL